MGKPTRPLSDHPEHLRSLARNLDAAVEEHRRLRREIDAFRARHLRGFAPGLAAASEPDDATD